MDSGPYVSAVVRIHGDMTGAPDEPTVADPHGVVAEVAAVLEGSGSGPVAPHQGHTAHDHAAHAAVPTSGGAVARAKGYFTRAGFEVHAPLGNLFSIGANQAHFEKVFERRLAVDEDRLGSPVTVEGAGQELPLTSLPEEIRETIESIVLPSPPDLF